MSLQKRTPVTDIKDWDRLRTVLAIRRAGNMSAAARVLAVNHTTVARRLAVIERDIGQPLFERHIDRLIATPIAEEIAATAEIVENDINSLLRRLSGLPDEITGTVRLTTTPYLAARLIGPSLPAFHVAHPGICIELIGQNLLLDISRREADLALRFARSEQASLVVRKLGSVAFACYASVDDSREWDTQSFLAFEEAGGATVLRNYMTQMANPEKIILRSNNLDALTDCVRKGMGCAILPCLSAEHDPMLRRVKAPKALEPLVLWLHYHEDLRNSPRLRCVIDALDELVRNSRGLLMPDGFPFDPD